MGPAKSCMKIYWAGSLPGAAAFIAFPDINWKKFPMDPIEAGGGFGVPPGIGFKNRSYRPIQDQAQGRQAKGLVMEY
jgi:hypothetical protein